jgi:hypothetical protein
MIKTLFGYEWDNGLMLQEEHRIKQKHYGLVRKPEQGRMYLSYYEDDLILLDWAWGEEYFWDAGRQGGSAEWHPAEMLTLYRPGPKDEKDGKSVIMIYDTWLGFRGFFHKADENLEQVFENLVQSAVDAFAANSSPADAVGYPGPDWPTTMSPNYRRGRGPSKTEVENPQEFLDRNQQNGSYLTPKSPMGN